MAQINKPNTHFNTVLYTGNGSTNAVTGVGFEPDWVWVKDRTSANSHGLFDVIRGATNALLSNLTNATVTNANYLQSFDTDGFTLGSEGAFNTNTNNYASWNWLAGGTASSNTDGSITSSVSANTTSGFSIVSYTGTGANATVGHGLGVAPKMIIIKDRNASTDWSVYHGSLGATKFIEINTNLAEQTNNTAWNDTEPTSSVFSIGTGGILNTSGNNYIAYCFAEKKGFSKFGSYTGNGNADGTFVYTGFKPAFVMTKSSSTGGTYYDWGMMDNKRGTYNVINAQVCANLSDQENSANIGNQYIDFLSNGFKPRANGSSHNASGVTYIYMAFAESPLVGTNNIPATAR